MTHRNSNENQSSLEGVYRFGDFELDPPGRLLTRKGEPVRLAPKVFDALLCFVSKAERLVTKDELTDILWPSTFVSEANLTNTIVSLRRIVGHDAIRTVSKHGYRFVLPVDGEPQTARVTYEKFNRAKELTLRRSLESMTDARRLYWICLAENPNFAPAWAWLGRCCWFLAKTTAKASADIDLAYAAFRRAFAIDPDLACAHRFYTPIEVDNGQALSAMARLLQRAERYPAEAETFAGLVQVLRYGGLLRESIQANKLATDLDPDIQTSIPHTLFLAGDYVSCADKWRTGYYLDAAAWAALGDKQTARTLLRDRLARMSVSSVGTALMGSLLNLLEDRIDEAVRQMELAVTVQEPEALIYFARHYSQMGLGDAAIKALKQAAQGGFVCSPQTLAADPWLGAVRTHAEFDSLLRMEQNQMAQVRSILDQYVVADKWFDR